MKVSRKIEGCFEGVSRVFLENFTEEEVSRMFQGCFMIFNGVSRVFHGSFKGVSMRFQGCFKEVSRVFHESFMEAEVS